MRYRKQSRFPRLWLAAVSVAAGLLLFTPGLRLAADEAGDRVRTALMNEDFASAKRFLQQVSVASDRTQLAGLIEEAEAQALADEITRNLSSGAARLAVQTLGERLPDLQARLSRESPGMRRLVALQAVAQQLAANQPTEPMGLSAAVTAALALGASDLESLERRRVALRAAIEESTAEARRIAERCIDFADRDRVTDTQNAMTSLERKFEGLSKQIDQADVTFPPEEANQARAAARALLVELMDAAGFASAQMSYFHRNFGDARKAVDAALVYAPTSRQLIELKVKIEEWQSRQRVWGDVPGR
jgi:hypothetical protein